LFQAGNFEDHPKYVALTQLLRDKEGELERSQGYAGELEAKIQKLLADFALFRTKAQQMLSSKDEEIGKIKGRSSSSPRE
jgi:hypothetical protein